MVTALKKNFKNL